MAFKEDLIVKKIVALLTAITLLGTFAGCHRNPPSGTDTEAPGATLTVSLSHSYAAKEILPGQQFMIASAVSFGENALVYGGINGDSIFGILDLNTGELVRKLVLEENCELLGMDTGEDTIEVMVKYYPQDEHKTEFRLELVTYDSDLKEIQREDVSSVWNDPSLASAWAKDAQGNMYLGDYISGIFCLTADGSVQNIEGTQGNEKLFRGCDGRVYGISADNSKSIDIYDPDTLSREVMNIELPDNGYNDTHILRGNTQYEYLCYTDEALFGVSVSDGSVTELLNWEESDFDSYVGNSAYLLLDGRVLVTEHNYSSDGSNTTWLLTARTQEELDAMTLISMASIGDSGGELVHLYNRQAQGHRIVLKSYRDETSDDFGSSALERDLLNGIIPDIVIYNNNLNYQMLSNKGLFEDLSTWMADDPDFHTEDYLMNFFDSLRYKDRLERIAFQYTVDAWMAKTEFLNGQTGLTLAEYQALDLPEGMKLLGSNFDRQMAFQETIYSQLGSLVDYENNTCSFDAPEFIQLLKLFQELPEQAEIEDVYAFAENRALLFNTSLWSLLSYQGNIQLYFGNEDVTLTGVPLNTGGNGGIFIPCSECLLMSAASEHKEEIWEFIKFCLNAENQMPDASGSMYGFPVRLDALEALMERDQMPREENHIHSMGNGYETIEIMSATAEEAETLTAYIKAITVSAYTDRTIWNIVSEEAGKYFSGDCTAEEAANIMQSRAALYLAEQS